MLHNVTISPFFAAVCQSKIEVNVMFDAEYFHPDFNTTLLKIECLRHTNVFVCVCICLLVYVYMNVYKYVCIFI